MVPTVPAFGGIPAGPELLIIFLVFALLAAPVIVIAAVVAFLKLRSDGEETDDDEADVDRIAALEAEVARLREKVDDQPSDRDGDGSL
ncbi:preprotein translocase subunit TatA [Halorubrum sp. DTA46]|uniref:preprotein translocase subunit TatA n=1 Tax=Halorubrum sp. DTA46 TaxID=3402162 RepID=UPI003AAC83E2